MARTGKVGPRDGKTGAYLLRSAFWRTALVLGMRGATKIIPIQEVDPHDVVPERCWPTGAVRIWAS